MRCSGASRAAQLRTWEDHFCSTNPTASQPPPASAGTLARWDFWRPASLAGDFSCPRGADNSFTSGANPEDQRTTIRGVLARSDRSAPDFLTNAAQMSRVRILTSNYVWMVSKTVLTLVPDSEKVPAGRASQAHAKGFSFSFCLGPSAQMATSFPPGARKVLA